MKIRCSAIVKDPDERELLRGITNGFVSGNKVLVEVEGGLDKFHDLAVLFEDFPEHSIYICGQSGAFLTESEEL